MKTYDIEITNVQSHKAFDIKINSQNIISSPDMIFVAWSKIGYNGEYSKVFKKDQRKFENDMHLFVFEKLKELHPEHFL